MDSPRAIAEPAPLDRGGRRLESRSADPGAAATGRIRPTWTRVGCCPASRQGLCLFIEQGGQRHIAMIANGTRNWIKMSNLIVIVALESGSVADPGH